MGRHKLRGDDQTHHRRAQAGNYVGQHGDPLHTHARQLRRTLVATNRVNLATKGSLGGQKRRDDRHHNHDRDGIGDLEAAHRNASPQGREAHVAQFFGTTDLREGSAIVTEQRQATRCIQRTQCGNEGGHIEA